MKRASLYIRGFIIGPGCVESIKLGAFLAGGAQGMHRGLMVIREPRLGLTREHRECVGRGG